jgi:hypothetical protein
MHIRISISFILKIYNFESCKGFKMRHYIYLLIDPPLNTISRLNEIFIFITVNFLYFYLLIIYTIIKQILSKVEQLVK